MIAGGGLGEIHPDAVGPIEMQAPNGVVDVAVADEAEATAVTKKLLAYFQGPTAPGPEPDQASLRANVYNVTDEKYIQSMYQIGYYGAPRNYAVSFDYKF